MNNRSILSIDLGSSYTKVAVRDDWDSRALPVTVPTLAASDNEFLIPSAAASVRRWSGTTWLFGREATVQPDAPLTRIHTDWKSDLFGKVEEKRERAAEIAKHFFEELRTSVPTEYQALGVRVGVPALEGGQDGTDLLKESLTKAGWSLVSDSSVVYEPEANLWGILTRGLNKTWEPPHFNFVRHMGRQPFMREMVEETGGFWRVMSKGTDSTRHSKFSVMVIDVGGFTTDFGLISIDSSFTHAWNRPNVESHSVRLGVRDLDAKVASQISNSSRAAIKKMTNDRWEKLKVQLYRGRSQAVRDREAAGGIVFVGEGEEKEKIQEAVEWFGSKVLTELNDFRKESPEIDAYVVTGGGSLIPGVLEIVRDACNGRYDSDFDFLTENAAKFQVDPDGDAPIGQVEIRLDENRRLIRVAGALGGASVVLE